jgi:hypothetical protein
MSWLGIHPQNILREVAMGAGMARFWALILPYLAAAPAFVSDFERHDIEVKCE